MDNRHHRAAESAACLFDSIKGGRPPSTTRNHESAAYAAIHVKMAYNFSINHEPTYTKNENYKKKIENNFSSSNRKPIIPHVFAHFLKNVKFVVRTDEKQKKKLEKKQKENISILSIQKYTFFFFWNLKLLWM